MKGRTPPEAPETRGCAYSGRWPENPEVTGLTPLGRPDLRGCALWTRGVFGDPANRGLSKVTQSDDVARVRSPCGKSAVGQRSCDKEGENATCHPGEEEEATRGITAREASVSARPRPEGM
eukprot:3126567-Prymnesium_polylepis.1